MASVFDVAKYILHKMGRLNTWKLQNELREQTHIEAPWKDARGDCNTVITKASMNDYYGSL